MSYVITQQPAADMPYEGASLGLLQPGEELHNGIWPKSMALWMAMCYMALFILRPWEQIAPWLQTIKFERVFAITLLLSVLLTRGFRFAWSLQTYSVVLFLFALGVSGVCAWKPELSWDSFYAYLILVFFYFVVVSVVRTPYELLFFVLCFILAMAIYLVQAQRGFMRYGGISAIGLTRLVGIETTFGDPNYLAESIVVSFPMLLCLYRIRNQLTHTWPPVWRRILTVGLSGYCVLAVVSLIMTNSRSGMAAFILFVSMVAVCGMSFSQVVTRVSIGGLLLSAIFIVMPAQYQNRLRSLWDPDAGPAYAKESAEGRSAGFQAGLEAFRRFPLTGVGPGSLFSYRVEELDGVALSTHSMPGQLLGGTGALGTGAFTLLIAATLLNCRRTKRSATDSLNDGVSALGELSFALRTALLLLLFEGLALHNLYRFNYLWLGAFALLASQFASSIRLSEEYDEGARCLVPTDGPDS